MKEPNRQQAKREMSRSADSDWVVVTGCSSGIGLDCARRLFACGYKVIATVRNNEQAKALQADGFKHIVVFDLDDAIQVDNAAAEIRALCGGVLKGLFNNAAYGQAGAVEDLSRVSLEKQFSTNVFGTHQLTRLLLPELRAHGQGRIIQNSSVLGFCAMPMRGAYNASKFALEGLTDTLRLELLKNNDSVRVVLIEPGPIMSRFRANSLKSLRENVDIENSRYAEDYNAAIERLSKPGPAAPFTLPASAVTDRVIEALEVSSPRRRYYVTVPTYLFAVLRRVLPTFLLDRLLIRAAG